MTNEERATLVAQLDGAAVEFEGPVGRYYARTARDQIEADGKRIAELEALIFQYVDPCNVVPDDQALVDDVQNRAAVGETK